MPSHLCANLNDLVKGLVVLYLETFNSTIAYPQLDDLLDELATWMGRSLDAGERDIVETIYGTWQKGHR